MTSPDSEPGRVTLGQVNTVNTDTEVRTRMENSQSSELAVWCLGP